MSAIDIERVRIIVLGDSGVGKTSFVYLAAQNEPIRSPSWTIGCQVEVKLHEYKEGTKEQQPYFIELWDVGGSHNHLNARHVFYNPCHGVILVHDLSNRKSEENLHKWLQELLSRDYNNTSLTSVTSVSAASFNEEFDSESFLGASQMPVLVVGTKLDQLDEKRSNTSSTFASQFGADEMVLDCRQTRYLAPGTSNAVKLARFYDKVIEMKGSRNYSERFGSNATSPILAPKYFSLMHQD